jgi:hypothetical protein
MYLTKTFFPCAITLLLATCGMAESPAPMPGSEAETAGQAAKTERAQAASPADPYLAPVPGETAPWTPGTGAQGRVAVPRGQGVSTTIIDPNCPSSGPYFDFTI